MNIHESAEDYLEQILMQEERQGYARSVDIANALGFSKASVSVAMKNLRNSGYIIMDDSSRIQLTEAGHRIADPIYERHRMISRFLMSIGVGEEAAEDLRVPAEARGGASRLDGGGGFRVGVEVEVVFGGVADAVGDAPFDMEDMLVGGDDVSVDARAEWAVSRVHFGARGVGPWLEEVVGGDGDGLVLGDHDDLVDGEGVGPVPLAALEFGGLVGGEAESPESQAHGGVLFVDAEDSAEDEIIDEHGDDEGQEAEEEDAEHPEEASKAAVGVGAAVGSDGVG